MLIIFTIIIITVLFGFAIPSLSLAPWVPTRKKDLERILDLASLAPDETFYDLGCGNGRIVFYIAQKSLNKSCGIELSFFFYLICKFRNFFQKHKAVFILNSLYKEDLKNADVVFIFAQSRSKVSGKLANKLKAELKKGARVMSYVFPISKWQPIRISKPTSADISIYLYKI